MNSCSEDKDAPSPLTRRLSTFNLPRGTCITSLRSYYLLSRALSHSSLYEEFEPARPRRWPSCT